MDTANVPTPKRSRKANWTLEESCHLLRLYKDYWYVIQNDFSKPGVCTTTKQGTWEAIPTSVHEAFPATTRSVKEYQTRWQTIVMASTPNIAQVRQYYAPTGKNLIPNYTFIMITIMLFVVFFIYFVQ